MGGRRERIWSLALPRWRNRVAHPEWTAGEGLGLSPAGEDAWLGQGDRAAAAATIVQRGLLQAEEKYLVDPGATLGTWFARVQETIAVASRIALSRVEESRPLAEEGVLVEQLGVQADICAEAIRAAARVWGGGSSPRARAEILDLVSAHPRANLSPSWNTVLVSLVCCSAALEPLARGMRRADLPMGAPTDCELVADCFVAVFEHAFEVVYALC